MRRLALLAINVLAQVGIFAFATRAQADPITVPTSLAPGAQYRLAFVTSTTLNSFSSEIAGYNAFVDGVAESVPELAALGQDWKAIASTELVNVLLNTSTDPSPAGLTGVPIFLLNDTKLVDDYDDLWDGSIDVPLNIGQSGVLVSGTIATRVWTGTGADGTTAYGLGGSGSTVGSVSSSTSTWINFTFRTAAEHHRLYAISGVLTVVPEPCTAFLLASGLAALAVRRRR